MKRFFYPAIAAIFIAGCSSASDNSTAGTNSAVKNNIANAPVQTTVASISNQTNPTLPPTANQTNGNAVNSTDANNMLTEVSSVSLKNMQRMKDKGKNGDKNAVPIPASSPTPFSAPDNSELSSTMNEKGIFVETRVFKNHPTLAKVEKSFIDLNNPTVKVYLKNGKVLTMPKGTVEKTESASAAAILQAVGVKP